MKPTLLLCILLLAACGPEAAEQTGETPAVAGDSAAPAGTTEPAAQLPAVETVNRRLEQARKDAAARQDEALQQVREAQDGSTP